ncbi:hypothetical protein AALP_AA5G053200 [Arabis alpina]|uniref:Uncharacterized protein n=1 Tax=Arabis alpina TaxID=50452 RepID=A0A087GV35_ARAAL|nr:hypothetical protein AALP_AA5G053200 [Arabis alpina]
MAELFRYLLVVFSSEPSRLLRSEFFVSSPRHCVMTVRIPAKFPPPPEPPDPPDTPTATASPSLTRPSRLHRRKCSSRYRAENASPHSPKT